MDLTPVGPSRRTDRSAPPAPGRWLELAKDDGRTRLAYHQPGTWSMKHNLIWDRVLGLNLFPASIGDAEIAWYLKVQNRYGLPVDNRTDTCLIDWALWSTEWQTQRIWLRREFTLPERPLKGPRLLLIYDEAPEVYFNGVLPAFVAETCFAATRTQPEICPVEAAAGAGLPASPGVDRRKD